jgi:hypothetical protein
MLFNSFNLFNIRVLILPQHVSDTNSLYCIFVVEYLPECGRKGGNM